MIIHHESGNKARFLNEVENQSHIMENVNVQWYKKRSVPIRNEKLVVKSYSP